MNTPTDRINWLKLAPRERDALIASKVLGWERVAPNLWQAPNSVPSSLPSFSQHWACAMMLAKTIADRGEFEVRIALSTAPCVVELQRIDGKRGQDGNYFVGLGLQGFPDAMCQAALQSAGLQIQIERPEKTLIAPVEGCEPA